MAGQKWGDLRDTDRSVRKVEKVWSAKDTLIANNMEELAVRFVRANKVLGVAVFVKNKKILLHTYSCEYINKK